MTADSLRVIGEALYGDRWQTDLAAAIGVNVRTIRRWAAGEPIPESRSAELRSLVQGRRAALDELVTRL